MVSIHDLLSWKIGELQFAADFLANRRTRLIDLEDDLRAARPPESWKTPRCKWAFKAHEKLRLRVNDLVAELSNVQITIVECSSVMKEAQGDLNRALDRAADHGFNVSHSSGVIMDGNTYPDEKHAKKAAEQMESVHAAIEAALKKADSADQDLAAALRSAVNGAVDGGKGSLEDAASSQKPPSLDDLTPEELAKKFGSEISLATMNAYLEGEAKLTSWMKAEFGAKAEYQVMMDGTVKMNLHVEGGLGLAVMGEGAASGGAGLSAGRTGDFEISFDSKEEAERFLNGFEDAAKDVNWSSYHTLGAGVAASVRENIAGYIERENVTSVKSGLYGKAELGFEAPYAKAGAEGRVDGYYDFKKDEYGLKVAGMVSAEHKSSGAALSAAIDGEVKTNNSGQPKELSLSGAINGQVASERLGINIPGAAQGHGVDVAIKMDDKNPLWHDAQAALKRGDVDRAVDLAMDHGQVIVKQSASTGNEQDAGDPGTDAGAQIKATKNVWVRDANSDGFTQIDPAG